MAGKTEKATTDKKNATKPAAGKGSGKTPPPPKKTTGKGRK